MGKGCPCSFEDSSYLEKSCGVQANFTIMMTLIDYLIRTNCKLSDPCRRASPRLLLDESQEFDFIIVGAGVAGPVLASRLSEKASWNVLLLEAGPEEPTATSIPGFAFSGVGSSLDWHYVTGPEKNACLSKNGYCKWPRGKMVAGSGGFTGMMSTRGHKSIYNSWANEGNTGWSYEEVLPYFKKWERNENPNLVDKEYHGFKGPMVVQRFPNRPKFADEIILAAKELGYDEVDFNGKKQTGFGIAQVMVKDGMRASAPRMYLRPVIHRKNLKVKINTHVTRVIIDPWKKNAIGVEYIGENGKVKKVLAKKEVILSAGAIGSPHLLLLSGIGPKENLLKVGVKHIHELKVGYNLHNHVSVGIQFYVNDTDNTNTLNMDSVYQYMKTRTGPLASTGVTQTTAFLQSSLAKNDAPDIQIFFDGYLANCTSSGRPDECSDKTVKDKCNNKRMINMRPTNLLAKSRGRLSLKSNDPTVHPVIQANYFADKRDIKVIIEGIKKAIDLSKTPTMKKWDMKIDTTKVEGCKNIPFGTDQYWECVIKTETGPENHQGGSCKMGPVGDTNAVVDPELRVHGITNLRVIDASVFPLVPNANPIGTILMTAEKGSDMIKAAWSEHNSHLNPDQQGL